jgi:hypothetical protein
LSAECDPTSSQAEGCAVLNTKLLITSIGMPPQKMHHDILLILANAFKENVFIEFIPELITAVYLGPDPDILVSSAAGGTEETHIESGKDDVSSKTTVIILFAIGCSVLLLNIVACFASSWFGLRSTK